MGSLASSSSDRRLGEVEATEMGVIGQGVGTSSRFSAYVCVYIGLDALTLTGALGNGLALKGTSFFLNRFGSFDGEQVRIVRQLIPFTFLVLSSSC